MGWIEVMTYEIWQNLKNLIEKMLIGFGKDFFAK
ncbi:hypothetical protein N836_14185 [Leptolyngbya sp. Heron Island J]|nr:hypothetical protein N836_14185 [Leptolyngbya sp. Heron Island J]